MTQCEPYVTDSALCWQSDILNPEECSKKVFDIKPFLVKSGEYLDLWKLYPHLKELGFIVPSDHKSGDSLYVRKGKKYLWDVGKSFIMAELDKYNRYINHRKYGPASFTNLEKLINYMIVNY